MLNWLKKINIFGFLTPERGAEGSFAWGVAKTPCDIDKALVRSYTPRKDVLGVKLGYTAQKDLVFQTRTQELHHKIVKGGLWSKRFLLAGDLCQQKQNSGSLLFVFEEGDGLFRWIKQDAPKGKKIFHVDLKERMFGWWFFSAYFLAEVVFHECKTFGASKEECFAVACLVAKLRHQYDKSHLLCMMEQADMVFDYYHKQGAGGEFNRERVVAILTHLQSWKILPENEEKLAFTNPSFFTNCQGHEHTVLTALSQVCYHRLSYCLSDTTNKVGEMMRRDTDVVLFDVDTGGWDEEFLARAQGSNMALTEFLPKERVGCDLSKWCVLELCSGNGGFDVLQLNGKKQPFIAGLWNVPQWGLWGVKRNKMFAE